MGVSPLTDLNKIPGIGMINREELPKIDWSVVMKAVRIAQSSPGHYDVGGLCSRVIYRAYLVLDHPDLARIVSRIQANQILRTFENQIPFDGILAMGGAARIADRLADQIYFFTREYFPEYEKQLIIRSTIHYKRKGKTDIILRAGSNQIKKESRWLILDDVVATGNNIREGNKILRSLGAETIATACWIDRRRPSLARFESELDGLEIIPRVPHFWLANPHRSLKPRGCCSQCQDNKPYDNWKDLYGPEGRI